MAKQELEEKKRHAQGPPMAVNLHDESSDGDDDDDILQDEFEGLSDVDSEDFSDTPFKIEAESESGSEDEDEDEDEDDDEDGQGGEEKKTLMEQVVVTPKLVDLGYGTISEGDSMEGSRSRSQEDLRDIGSARRLDDDDTADSAWKDTAGPSSSSAGQENPSGSGSGGDGAEVKVLGFGEDEGAEVRVSHYGEDGGEDVMEMDEEEKGGEVAAKDDDDGENGDDDDGEDAEEEEEEEEGEEQEEEEEEELRLDAEESESEGEPSASDGGDEGAKGDSSKSSAYSRAFSKILQSKAAKESETGPVLAARQTLVARKLEEEAGEGKEKKDTKKEKKELREKAHLYPQSVSDTKEKDLVKLATRGVVKLFNAVSKAQKVQASADGRDARVVAKESRAAFLAEVKGSDTSVAVGSKRRLPSSSEPPFKFGTSESQNQSTSRWSVVKDDFMIGKQKLKDWDKDEEMGNVAGDQQINNGIDDDSD